MNHHLSRKIGLGLIVVLLGLQPLATAAVQVESGAPAASERAGALRKRMEATAKALNLTDQQKEKLKPIIRSEMIELKALRADPNLSRREKLTKLKAIRDENVPKIKAILTAEQFEKWQKIVEKRRGRLRG